MGVRLIVPRRADGGHRDRLWDFCRAHWERELPGAEIVEGHHDEGPFNRSAAINQAAQGEWDVAVILDGDVILDGQQVTRAANEALDSGRMVLPFRARRMLHRRGTREILDGYDGDWQQFVRRTMGVKHVSSCVVVPRALWDAVGGFDERFEGWGGEDDAFHAACLALAGVERMRGDAWHLWHETSPWRDHESPLYKQALALSDRYVATTEAAEMRRLIAEPRGADQVVVVVLTTGKRETLRETLASSAAIHGPIGRRVIACHRRWAETVAAEHGDWDVVPIDARGYGTAVRNAIHVALGSGQPWIFWLEDDFTFEGPVDLAAMQAVMEANPHLAQLSLLRQPWYEEEVEAGGIIEADREAFTQREGFVEHAAYWTMNPMLVRRRFLAEHPWPQGRGSERRYGQEVFSNGTRAGIIGEIGDAPRCTHIGRTRAGTGY